MLLCAIATILPNNIEKIESTAKYGRNILVVFPENNEVNVAMIAANAAALPIVENKPVTVVGAPW
jgi:hypothetical protein